MSAPPGERRRSSKTRSSTSLPASAAQSKRKTNTATMTTAKTKSRSRSRSLKRSKSPRSKRSSRKAAGNSVDAGETLRKVTSRRYVYNVDENHRQGEPQINEKLDISCQSLTVITSAVFNNTSVNELDVSSNNVRSIPVELRNMQQLVYLDLSRNPIQCQHPNDSSGLPIELAQLPNLRVIILVECNLLNVPPVIWNCVQLRALDISRNRIGLLPPEVRQLTSLRYLSAQQAGLQTLPAEIACCRKLTDLLLWGNAISTLPPSIKYLTELRRLELTCRNFAVDVDNYMDSLLQSGQIQSEHIPSVLFDLPRLEELDLENTKVNVLPEQSRANQLRKLHLAGNFLKSIPPVILSFTQLTLLDISNNFIGGLPDEICQLVQLERLSLKHNQISHCSSSIKYLQRLRELYLSGNKIKQLPREIGQLKELKTLFLDDNLLTDLPETVSELAQLETLVLSDNRLEQLPADMHKMASLTAAHAYRKMDKYGLWVHPNPTLHDPPGIVWRTGSTARLFRHLTEQKVRRLATGIHRQKLVVIGGSGSGKSNLIETLITRSTSTASMPIGTSQLSSVQHRVWTTPNQIKFTVLEISGSEAVQPLIPLLVDKSTLVVVVFDVSSYTPETFEERIGSWLDVVMMTAPGAVVHLVGTHTDTCQESSRASSCATAIWQLATEHIDKRRAELTDSRERLRATRTSGKHGPIETDDACDAPAGIRLAGDGVSLTGATIAECQALVGRLESIAVDIELFADRVNGNGITSQVKDFGAALRRRQTGLCVSWTEALDVGESLGMTADDVGNAAERLRDVGEMLWWPGIPAVNKYIFTRPSLVISILQHCFRRSDDPYFGRRELFNAVGQFNEQLDDVIQRFTFAGIASRKFLLSLLFDLSLKNGDYERIVDVFRRLDLLYVADSDDDDDNVLVLPAMMPADSKSRVQEITTVHWPAPRPPGQHETVASVKFFVLCPKDFLARLACRIKPSTNRRLLQLYDVFVDDVVNDVSLLCLMRRLKLEENAVAELLIKVRSSNLNEAHKVQEMAMNHVISVLNIYRCLIFVVDRDFIN